MSVFPSAHSSLLKKEKGVWRILSSPYPFCRSVPVWQIRSPAAEAADCAGRAGLPGQSSWISMGTQLKQRVGLYTGVKKRFAVRLRLPKGFFGTYDTENSLPHTDNFTSHIKKPQAKKPKKAKGQGTEGGIYWIWVSCTTDCSPFPNPVLHWQWSVLHTLQNFPDLLPGPVNFLRPVESREVTSGRWRNSRCHSGPRPFSPCLRLHQKRHFQLRVSPLFPSTWLQCRLGFIPWCLVFRLWSVPSHRLRERFACISHPSPSIQTQFP